MTMMNLRVGALPSAVKSFLYEKNSNVLIGEEQVLIASHHLPSSHEKGGGSGGHIETNRGARKQLEGESERGRVW